MSSKDLENDIHAVLKNDANNTQIQQVLGVQVKSKAKKKELEESKREHIKRIIPVGILWGSITGTAAYTYGVYKHKGPGRLGARYGTFGACVSMTYYILMGQWLYGWGLDKGYKAHAFCGVGTGIVTGLSVTKGDPKAGLVVGAIGLPIALTSYAITQRISLKNTQSKIERFQVWADRKWRGDDVNELYLHPKRGKLIGRRLSYSLPEWCPITYTTFDLVYENDDVIMTDPKSIEPVPAIRGTRLVYGERPRSSYEDTLDEFSKEDARWVELRSTIKKIQERRRLEQKTDK